VGGEGRVLERRIFAQVGVGLRAWVRCTQQKGGGHGG
jgi:hypothetical protein